MSKESTADRVKHKLQHAGDKAKQKLAAARTATSVRAHDARVGVEHQIQAHPLKAIGIAFATGAIVGLLLRRRR